jgi:hypothetical protein
MNDSQVLGRRVCPKLYCCCEMVPNPVPVLGLYEPYSYKAGTNDQEVTLSNSSTPMDLDLGLNLDLGLTPTALGVFYNHDTTTTAGSNLQCTKVRTEWTKPKSLAVTSPKYWSSRVRLLNESSSPTEIMFKITGRQRCGLTPQAHGRSLPNAQGQQEKGEPRAMRPHTCANIFGSVVVA